MDPIKKLKNNTMVYPTSTKDTDTKFEDLSNSTIDNQIQIETLHRAIVEDSPTLVMSALTKSSNNSAVGCIDLLQYTSLLDDIYDNESTLSLIEVTKFILECNFSEEDKMQILLTNNKNGKPILYNTFSNQKLRRTSAKIISLIMNSNLTEKNKILLLQAKTDTGSNWLYDVLQANDVETVSGYANFILNFEESTKHTNFYLELTENIKYALLTPIDREPISIDILAKNEAVRKLQNMIAEKYPISYQQAYSDEEIRRLNDKKITKLAKTSRIHRANGDLINYPTKGRYTPLNCKVPAFHKQNTRIKGRRIAIADTVECRHLADLYARDTGKTSELLEKLDSYENITAHPKFQKDLVMKRYCSTEVSKTGYFFDINNFPKVMNKLILKNWGKANYQERFILSSISHVMGIKIENKDNGKFTKVSFYDPNDTSRQMSTDVRKPVEVDKLTASFVAYNDDLIEDYFIEYDGPGTLLSVDLTTENQCKTYVESDITASLCILMAKYGHFKNADLGRQINSKYTADEIFSLYNHEYGLINEAIFYTNPENLRYIIKSILDSPMSKKQKVYLLSNKNGLQIGLLDNITVCISAFCNEVLSSDILSEDDKHTILTTKLQGSNGLYHAFTSNNPESLRVFVKSILTSDLTENTKRNMLDIFSVSKKISALHFIYISPESFHAFKDTVTEFASDKLKNEIFAENDISPDDNNIFESIIFDSITEIEEQLVNQPGIEKYDTTYEKLRCIIIVMLSVAFKRKDYKNITKFLKAFLANKKLTNSQKEQILNIHTQKLEYLDAILLNDSKSKKERAKLAMNELGLQ